jgi:hypothetical protein
MKKLWIVPTTLLALSGGLLADTVTSATGSFSLFPSGFASSTPAWVGVGDPPATEGTPFWNNPSQDTGTGGSHMMNIGYVLTDSGGLEGTPSVIGTDTVADDFTAADGADPASFSFVSAATAYNISLIFADSSLDTGKAAQGTVFGYYVGSTFTPIYTPDNTNSPIDTLPFDPTTAGNSYGFYATVCYGAGACEIYTTGNGNSGNSSGAADWNHFALFELASGNYVIGFEDGNSFGGEAYGDYNDVVVELSAAGDPPQAPEPGSIATMGLGLLGLSIYLGRKATRS